ncbi:MAG: plastocyanin/azurin family copper-binding protein [Nanoarchaeota archaeon]|nr:plastocyanin/azurin family copper-binding protein [Nanoarchaeota archaeon]
MKTEVTVLVVVIVLVLAVAGYFIFQPKIDSNVPLGEENETNVTVEQIHGFPPPGNETPLVIEPKTHNIIVSGFEFTQSEILIKVGDTVIWTNMDFSSHTVTSDSGEELDSEYLGKGGTYSHTFTKVGEYSYYCVPHPYMKGKVIVE